MRKLILIAVLVLAAATAQAGQMRGLILASSEGPNSSERIEAVNPGATKPEEAKVDVRPEVSKPEVSKPVVSRPAVSKSAKVASRPAKNVHIGKHGDEAKARSIAARYGVYW